MSMVGVASRQRSTAPEKSVPLVLATLGMVTISFGRTRIGDWTLSDLLFALAGVSLVVGRLGPLRRPHTARAPALSPMVLGTGLLLTMGTLSSLVAVDPLGSMAVVLRFAWLSLIWLWILQGVAPTVKAFEMLVRGLRWTVIISSTVAIGGFLGIVRLSETINETRETGLYDHPNHLGAMLVVGLPFFMLDTPAPRSGQRKAAVRWGLVAYVSFAILTTGSLTTVIGVVVVILTVLSATTMTRSPARRRSQPLVRILGLFTVAIVAGYLLQSSTPATERFQALGDDSSGTSRSAQSRADHANAVLSNVDQLLVLGVGLDRASANIDLGSDQGIRDGGDGSGDSAEVHNIYLKLLHNAGMLALVGFLILVLTSLRNSWMLAIHSRGKEIYGTAVALTASLVAVNVVDHAHPQLDRVGHELFVVGERAGRGERDDEHRAHRREHDDARQRELRVDRARQPRVARPRPPERGEHEQSPTQPLPARVGRHEAGDLRDGEHEDEVEEEL
jgi:O-antigen ligase